MDKLARFPSQKDGEVVLYVKRKHRREAEDLASTLALRISERQLKRLDDQMDGMDWE